MSLRRGALIAALLASIASPSAQRSRGPLASVRIVGGPVATLDIPAPVPVAYDAAAVALQASGVPFELEGAAPHPDRPLTDFAHPPQRGEFLTGLTVGDALDAIASAQPRFQWTETGGTIRAGFGADAQSPLERRIARFEVRQASPHAAFETLAGLLFSDRETTPVIAATEQPPSPLRERAPPPDRTITLALDTPSVRDVFRAIARAHGALSWSVRYDSEPAMLERAIVTLVSPRQTLVLRGPAVTGSRVGAANDLVRLSQNGDLSAMLAAYMRTSRVNIGAELLPQPVAQRFLRSIPAINVANLTPAQAMARIVAHDSRYTVEERDGRFLVRPVSAALPSSALDARLPDFIRNGEPLDVAVADLLQRLGADTVRPSTVHTADGVSRDVGEAARLKPVTVALSQPTTVREALDAICRSLGDASWFFRYQAMVSPGRAGLSLQIESPDGWSLSRGFSIAGAAPPSRGGDATLPPEIDRELGRVFPGGGSGLISPFHAVAAAASLPMGVELVPPGRFDDDPRYQRNSSAVPIGPGRIGDVLAAMLDRAPEFAMRVRNGVVNIGPAAVIDEPDHFLNRRIGAYRVADLPAWRAVVLLRRRMQGASVEARDVETDTLPAVLDDTMVTPLSRPVTVSLAEATPREVLNAIVREHGGLTWTVAYEPQDATRAARVAERDSVILLRPARDYGISSLRIARDGRLSAFNTRTPLVRVPSTRGSLRATLQLPFPEPRLDEEIDRLCRALEIRCAIELISRTPPGWDMLRGSTAASYDFSGLTPAEALDALTGLAPGLAWRRDGEVYRISSAALSGARDLPLDRRVRNFEGRFESLTALAHGVRELFTIVPAPRRGATPVNVFGATGGANRTTMSPTAGALERPLSLKLRNVSVRQILDEMAKAHGTLSWSVQYIDAHGTYPEFELRLSQPDSATGLPISIR